MRWDATAPANGADMKEVAGWKRKEKMVQLLPVSTVIWWVLGSHQYFELITMDNNLAIINNCEKINWNTSKIHVRMTLQEKKNHAFKK